MGGGTGRKHSRLNCSTDMAMITHIHLHVFSMSPAACFNPNKLMAVGDDSDTRALLFIYTERTAANRSLMHDTAWM